MPMNCLDSDLDVLFASSDFGEAEGALRNGVGEPIAGIFDDDDVESQNGEGITILVRQTTFTCASSKAPNLEDGETLHLRGQVYIVRFWKEESGVLEIHLEAS